MQTFGAHLRAWRRRRGLSQLGLAVETGVSQRHLSFLETGRADPSAEMVRRLARSLGLSLPEKNVLLLAAGFAPIARAAPSPTQAALDAAIRVVESQPFPAVVLDRHRDILRSNRAASRLLARVLPSGTPPPSNLYRLLLHPEGLAPHIVDFASYSARLLARLQHDAEKPGADHLYALLAEVSAWPGVGSAAAASSDLLRLRDGDRELAFVTTLATVGLGSDELVIETLFPAG